MSYLVLPGHEKKLAEMPEAEFAIIHDAAHYGPLEDPFRTPITSLLD